jgi:hypothetical protein
MNFEQKYYKYKNKYNQLKSEISLMQNAQQYNNLNTNLNNILGGDDKTPTLTPIFTEEPKPEPTPTPTPAPTEIPEHGKIEWNIDPEKPRNLRNNTSVKLTKKNGESFIINEGDVINYISKSGFTNKDPKTGDVIPLDPNNPEKRLPRQVGRQLGQVRSFLDINNGHTGNPTAIEVYRHHYDTRVFEKDPTHKTFRFDQVSLYKPNETWPPGAGL